MSDNNKQPVTHNTIDTLITSVTFGGRLYTLEPSRNALTPDYLKEPPEVTEEQKCKQFAGALRLEENITAQVANSMKYDHLELITVVGILERVKSQILNY